MPGYIRLSGTHAFVRVVDEGRGSLPGEKTWKVLQHLQKFQHLPSVGMGTPRLTLGKNFKFWACFGGEGRI
jgi:hypothetical protein